MPSTEVVNQFPLIALIVVLFTLAGGALGLGIRWVWTQYKDWYTADLAWKAAQNKLREDAVAAQNELWRKAMEERDRRYEQFDQARNGTIINLAGMIKEIATMLQSHDQQAKEIQKTVDVINHKIPTRPAEGQK